MPWKISRDKLLSLSLLASLLFDESEATWSRRFCFDSIVNVMESDFIVLDGVKLILHESSVTVDR